MLLRMLLLVGGPLLASLPHGARAAAPLPEMDEVKILADTRTLSSDAFQGRKPGTPGEEITVGFLSKEYAKMGLRPGGDKGSYSQRVPLLGVQSKTQAQFNYATKTVELVSMKDIVAPSLRDVAALDIKDSDVVFAGYGINAPEFNWDDFKGVDLRGKTIVVLVGDPPLQDPKTPGSLDPAMFGGKAMTYYGRWTYKYEIAAKLGVAACLIVHETEAASYPFDVVVESRGRENQLIDGTSGPEYHPAVEGWLSLEAAKALFSSCGMDYAAAKASALSRGFKPVAMPAKASFKVDNTLRHFESHNVIGVLPGSSPALSKEAVIYCAHWDHLGIDPNMKGDQIYNGARDNATGVAGMLEIARYMASLWSNGPKRNVVFVATTGEESGLLGAAYYVAHPTIPLERTLACLNIDVLNPLGPTSSIEVCGYGSTTIDEIGARIASQQGRTLVAEGKTEYGAYFRSDHFEFAKAGVPSFYAHNGPLSSEDQKLVAAIPYRTYHTVRDEVLPEWTMKGAAQDASFLVGVGLEIANGTQRPAWTDKVPFKVKH